MQVYIFKNDTKSNNIAGFTNSGQNVFNGQQYYQINFDVVKFQKNVGFQESIIEIEGFFDEEILRFISSDYFKIYIILQVNEEKTGLIKNIPYYYDNCTIQNHMINNAKSTITISSGILYNDNITNYITKTCNAKFCDKKCGLDVNNYTFYGSVTDLRSQNSFVDKNILTNNVKGSNFKFGSVHFTSGANKGLKYDIRTIDTLIISLIQLLKYPLLIGDTYKALQSCQKRYDDCKNFKNEINFRGF